MPRKAPPQKSGPETARFRWRTWLIRGALLALGLAVGIGVPLFYVLDKQVRAEFEQLAWQEPTRVYARPLALAPGQRLDVATLELELAASGYRNNGGGDLPGTYQREDGRFRIATRAFTDVDGPVPARKLDVVVSRGKVTRLTERGSDMALATARIDPVRIATLYGGNLQEERRLVQLKDVPPLLVTGLQAVEDRNFKHHHGIDPWGMLRAMWVNVREGELEQGASTLTQQLVRSLFLTREKRWSRKFREISYSLIIEARYDKQRILEAYLNQVYMGQQGNQSIHGVAAASEFWFGRELASLRTEEMALLVGMIKGPSVYDPRRRPEDAKADWRNVLPGDRSDLIWQGAVDYAALPKLKNPASGWIYNSNNTPFTAAGAGSDLASDAFSPVMGIELKQTNRSWRAYKLLSEASVLDRATLEAIKYDTGYEREGYVDRLFDALEGMKADGKLAEARDLLLGWDFTADNRGKADAIALLMIRDFMSADYNNKPFPDVAEKLQAAADHLTTHFGRLDPPMADLLRLRQGGLDLPLDGGSDTLRASTTWDVDPDGRLSLKHGDSFIQWVEWLPGKPVVSRSIQPFGAATTRPKSKHYNDQMRLFVEHKLKPVHFWRDDVLANASKRTTVTSAR